MAFRSSSSLKVQVGQPKLKLTCEGPAETTVGSDVHLVLMVHNTGTGAAGEVRISGQLLSVIQPNSAVQPASTARPLAANEPSQSVTQVGVLEPGESRVVDTVLSAREAGTFRLVLSASCEDGAKASASHEVTVQGRPEPVTQEPGSR